MKQEQSVKNKEALAPYKNAVVRYIRARMVLKQIKYEDLVVALQDRGVHLTANNLRNRVSKGLFSADMLLMLIEILDVQEDAMQKMLEQVGD